MTHNFDNTAVVLPATERRPCSAAAERMRRHRERRRDGLRCVTLDVHDGEIDALARRGFLKDDARNDLRSIEIALYEFLEHALG
jgi:hypothetical protein